MKKLTALFFALVLVFALSACGGSGDDARAEYAGEYALYAVSGEGMCLSAEEFEMTGSLVLNADGSGSLDFEGEGGDVTDWNVTDGEISITVDGDTATGTYEAGIIFIDLEEAAMYFVAEGADTSSIPVQSFDDLLSAAMSE